MGVRPPGLDLAPPFPKQPPRARATLQGKGDYAASNPEHPHPPELTRGPQAGPSPTMTFFK